MSTILYGWGAGLGIQITVPTPTFPNVPQLLGVPQLARSLMYPPTAPPSIGTQATQGTLWQATQAAPVWGVFDASGNLAIAADSVQEFGWRKENRIPNFPIQQGAFGTYNRVALPFENSITLTKGGTLTDRTAFLQAVDAVIAQANIALYTIRTPEKSYANVSCTRAEVARRGTGNAFYFDVELFFIEINEVAAQYSTTSTASTPVTPTNNASVPSAVPTVNRGLNYPQTPSTSTVTLANDALFNNPSVTESLVGSGPF